MSNVLDDHERQQICALGRLGWPLLRIQQATGVRRETVGAYLRTAGIPVRGRGRPSEDKSKAAITGGVSTDSDPKPAIVPSGVSTDSRATRAPSASACAPYRELIADALGRGRNAVAIYQDLVDADKLRAAIPRARLAWIEDAAHWIMEEKPAEVAAELRAFLG